MPELHTTNSKANIPSCFTLVSLKAKNIIPIINYCKAIKVIRNTESNSVGIRSLSRSCDIQVEDKKNIQFLHFSI
jgi:hypothetical protein